MAGVKTVVRVRLRAPELSMAAAKRGLRTFSGELQGTFAKGEEIAQSFKYPVAGDVSERTTFQYAFLRSIEPGTYKLKLVLAAPGGKQVGEASTDISVPEVGNVFSPDMAPGEASTMPAAEAIVIADEADSTTSSTAASKLKIMPAGPRGADRPPAPRGRRPAADHEGRVLPRGQAHPGALASSVHRRDRSRRGAAPADRPSRRIRRLGPAHRRGRLGHQPGQRAPRRQDPAAAGPGGRRRARQGRRPVDLRRHRQTGRALPRTTRSSRPGRPPVRTK